MAIKRYFANADNTITNAFEEDLKTRGTGSNMGQADILEIFSIYAQESSSSVELERVLVNFPISSITADRTNGIIPKSGSVSFFIKMTNAPHPGQTPRDFKLQVSAVSSSWQEGDGLDMENYSDLTYGGIGSNWINANNSFATATSTIIILDYEEATNGKIITLVDYLEDGIYITADSSQDLDPGVSGSFGTQDVDSNAKLAKSIALGINATTSTITAAPVDGSSATITFTQASAGLAGNRINRTDIDTTDGVTLSNFVGGDGEWANVGGDYYTDASSSFTQSLDTGIENLELDISPLVEQWIGSDGNILGTKPSNGVGVRLTNAYEGYSSSSTGIDTGSIIHNTAGATKTYYSKKFFSRQSEFFFKRPYLEARWNSVTQDDRGSFYFSSSLAPAEDNLNTIYLYNYVRGRLTNIPGIDTGNIYVQLYSGSLNNSGPKLGSSAFALSADGVYVGGPSRSGSLTYATGGYVSTGIYSASLAFTGATGLSPIFDVWSSYRGKGINAATPQILYFTGSINPEPLTAKGYTTSNKYVLAMPDLQKEYYKDQTARLRLFIRKKDWSPNIYVKATSTIPSLTVPSASYRVSRVIDHFEVVDYGTGSLQHTALSYDVSGSYFDLDMSLFEPGYQYQLQFSFKNENTSTYYEQPYLFKFRVEK